MAVKRRFAVLGLGSFGGRVARELFKSGAEVLAVDRDAHAIAEISDDVTKAVVGDCRHREVLEELGIGAYNAVIVSLGESIEASTLVTFHLRDLKVPRIIVKAVTNDHRGLLDRVGATDVVFPEEESAQRLAKQIVSTNLLDYFELSDGYLIAEVAVPHSMVGRTLRELDVRKNFGVQVLLIQESVPEQIRTFPNPDTPLKDSDVLLVAGRDQDVYRIAKAG